jgi:hypothetical protein
MRSDLILAILGAFRAAFAAPVRPAAPVPRRPL